MHIRDLIQFLTELSENNSRAWFAMNRPRYDILREEFLTLVTGLIAGIAAFDPPVAGCDPKKALFRINRDLRFSKDKRPYKTTFSASILPSGRKKPSEGGGPVYYFLINAAGQLHFGVGEYAPPTHRLRAIRQHIAADAQGFGKLLEDKKLQAAFGGFYAEGKLTHPPKGFAIDLPHIEHIKLKNFFVWKETALDRKAPAAVTATLLAGFRDAYPLVAWLRNVPLPES
ncbi:DUF2461 domain-containing protein [Herminiimonas sp. CN]|uniref:DUF2461 domain-containing protein n=1 Tax=Herminiimonas sp. CN TaxID=1349818 RepID=UPI000473BE87|nr:DUF2461 domain-containing protein [Herminiimonas sp. CN]